MCVKIGFRKITGCLLYGLMCMFECECVCVYLGMCINMHMYVRVVEIYGAKFKGKMEGDKYVMYII